MGRSEQCHPAIAQPLLWHLPGSPAHPGRLRHGGHALYLCTAGQRTAREWVHQCPGQPAGGETRGVQRRLLVQHPDGPRPLPAALCLLTPDSRLLRQAGTHSPLARALSRLSDLQLGHGTQCRSLQESHGEAKSHGTDSRPLRIGLCRHHPGPAWHGLLGHRHPERKLHRHLYRPVLVLLALATLVAHRLPPAARPDRIQQQDVGHQYGDPPQ